MTGVDFVVVLGGEGALPLLAARLDTISATVIAADSGLGVAEELGLTVDHVVGDFDSVDLEDLRRAEERGCIVHRHATDKDATDSELAIELALKLAVVPDGGAPGDRTAQRLTVLGRGEGRLDHLLADLLMLGSARLDHFEVTAVFGPAVVSVVRPDGPRTLAGTAGAQVSLIPVSMVARGLATEGLRWPLFGADLAQGSTRGVSNEFIGGPAMVSTSSGTILVVQPGTTAPPISTRSTTYDPSPKAAPAPTDG